MINLCSEHVGQFNGTEAVRLASATVCEQCRINESLSMTDEDYEVREPELSWYKPCVDCGAMVERYRGDGDVSCDNCGALYNAFGQRLRDDALGNPSMYDDEIDDLEGFERQHADDI